MAQIIFYILIGLMIFQAIMLVRDVVTHRDDLGPGNWLHCRFCRYDWNWEFCTHHHDVKCYETKY